MVMTSGSEISEKLRAELEAIAGRVIDDSVEKIKEQLRKVIPGLDFGGTSRGSSRRWRRQLRRPIDSDDC